MQYLFLSIDYEYGPKCFTQIEIFKENISIKKSSEDGNTTGVDRRKWSPRSIRLFTKVIESREGKNVIILIGRYSIYILTL